MSTIKKQAPRNTIIGKKALLISARGETELAAQMFYYDQIREVRLDKKNNEVKLLMTYDDSYFRVFQVFPVDESESSSKDVEQKLLKFYNDLLYSAMGFTQEEVENLNAQVEKQRKEAQKLSEEKNTSSDKSEKTH